MHHKSDAAKMFKQFLANIRADRAPSQLVIVRSDEGGELRGGNMAAFVDRDALSRNSPQPTVPSLMG